MYTVRLGASVRKSACRREGNQAPFSVLAQWWHVTISIHRGPVEIQFNVKQPCDTFRTASSNEVMKITAINLIKKNEDSDCKSHMPSVELRSFKAHSKHRAPLLARFGALSLGLGNLDACSTLLRSSRQGNAPSMLWSSTGHAELSPLQGLLEIHGCKPGKTLT